jgi:hypothetical protein
MTARDERSRRAAARLHGLVVSLAGEVVARGGRLDRYDLTDEEQAEARRQARTFWQTRMRDVQDRVRQTASKARGSSRRASSTE